MKWPVAYQTWGEDEIQAVMDCLREGSTTMGPRVAEFEREFAKYLGIHDAVMVNSGSSANFVMMLAAIHLGMLKPGDEVLMPAVTWPTQAWACILAGLKVRFVDIEVETLQMDPAKAFLAVTPETKAIFLTHLMGVPSDLNWIRKAASAHGLHIFEDCCESLGARYTNPHFPNHVGTFGVASAFSFFYSHHITTMEGGMIASDWPRFTDACRMIRAHGWDRHLTNKANFNFIGPGLNFRPTELNAAMGLVQLPKLDAMNAARNENHQWLSERITDYFQWTKVKPYALSKPAWFAFPLVLKPGENRAEVMRRLAERGIETRPIAGGNLLRQPAFVDLRDCGGPFPNADRVHDGGFYIGLPPFKTDMDEVLNSLLSQVPA